jgi:hypothetical protein
MLDADREVGLSADHQAPECSRAAHLTDVNLVHDRHERHDRHFDER